MAGAPDEVREPRPRAVGRTRGTATRSRPTTAKPPHRPPDGATVREIHRRLKREYGPLDPGRSLDPLEELVLTILSQNTSDVNSGRAYEALHERYPSWDAVAAAPVRQLAATIRAGGLANIKAPRIKEVLREIRDREGRFDLSWMEAAPDAEVEEYLVSLPGVGPKTAACVLAFSLGRAALPVDTHVHRVAARLGMLPEGVPATRAHGLLRDLVPARLRVEVHVGLIRHGRTTCRAGRPACERCPLVDLCPAAKRYLGGTKKSADRAKGRRSTRR